MTWFWLNIPLSVLIFGAVTSIPLWVVIKHPDTGPAAPDMQPDVPDVPDVIPALVTSVGAPPGKTRLSWIVAVDGGRLWP